MVVFQSHQNDKAQGPKVEQDLRKKTVNRSAKNDLIVRTVNEFKGQREREREREIANAHCAR